MIRLKYISFVILSLIINSCYKKDFEEEISLPIWDGIIVFNNTYITEKYGYNIDDFIITERDGFLYTGFWFDNFQPHDPILINSNKTRSDFRDWDQASIVNSASLNESQSYSGIIISKFDTIVNNVITSVVVSDKTVSIAQFINNGNLVIFTIKDTFNRQDINEFFDNYYYITCCAF